MEMSFHTLPPIPTAMATVWATSWGIGAGLMGSPLGSGLAVAVALGGAVGVWVWRSSPPSGVDWAQQELAVAWEAAERARLEAEAANEAKSTFVANLSHELRTPLSAIIGYAEMLGEDADPETQKDLERIESSSHYLMSLLNDVLDLSKVAAGRLDIRVEPVDLGGLVEELRGVATAMCTENGNDLEIVCPEVQVMADPIRLRQILINLISNAAKFTANGRIALQVRRQGSEISVAVNDTGIGMDDFQVSKLFATFSQVHRSDHERYGGTGLGLALSRELARLMGGDITVESAPGEGTCFTLSVPTAAS